MNPPEDAPYIIEEFAKQDLAVITFAKQCDYRRTEADEKALFSVVEQFGNIACDFTHTETIASEWLRWLARMAAQARRTGKNLFLFNVKTQVLKTADLLGQKDVFQVKESLEKGLAQ